jgi:hypothetical protein
MGLTYDQAKSLGIGHLHPAASGGKSRERELLDGLGPGPTPSEAPSDGMNRTERSFAETLGAAGKGFTWWREPVKLRLAGRTWYTPDFLVADFVWDPMCRSNAFTFVEVKGFMRDDAAVKLKVAARAYPCFRWLLVVRDGRHGWAVREVTAHGGIGRDPIHVPWIHT